MAKYSTLTALFSAIANSLRAKTGTTGTIIADDFPSVIEGISTGVEGGIIPTGTKSITANGTHDVRTYETAEVNVPTGITPTGTKNITANGTYDVTNFASASVNVPSPEPICVTRQITIGADQGNGTATNTTVLSGDEFIKKHYANGNLSITMIPLFTPVAESTVVSWIWHSNRVVSNAKSSYCGFGAQSAGTASHAAIVLNTAALTGNTYAVGFRAKSSGDVQLYTRANSIVKAGNYMLILTCTD